MLIGNTSFSDMSDLEEGELLGSSFDELEDELCTVTAETVTECTTVGPSEDLGMRSEGVRVVEKISDTSERREEASKMPRKEDRREEAPKVPKKDEIRLEASKMPRKEAENDAKAEVSPIPSKNRVRRVESQVIFNGRTRGGRVLSLQEVVLARIRKSDNKNARERRRLLKRRERNMY